MDLPQKGPGFDWADQKVEMHILRIVGVAFVIVIVDEILIETKVDYKRCVMTLL